MTAFSINPLDLAALLASRVCHDLISPVGAIMNGLEVLEEDVDAETRKLAHDLIRKSASAAAAQLRFCRLAFGSAGSAGASIDTGEAEETARGLLVNEKTNLQWDLARELMPKNKVKLILNLCLIATTCIPRGGMVLVSTQGGDASFSLKVEARGAQLKVPSQLAQLLAGAVEPEKLDARAIQAYYTGLIARTIRLAVNIGGTTGESVTLEAVTVPAHSLV